MLKILLFILILCAAVFAGPYLADEQGYVHISTQDYIVETSLTTAIVIAIVSFIVLYFVVSLLFKFIHLPRGTQSLFRRRQAKKGSSLAQEAALYFAEGEYARALAVIRRIKPQARSVETYFIGAQSAFALQDYDLCRIFLDEAKDKGKEAFIASSIIRAKLNLQIGNAKAALEVLDELKKSYSSKEVTRLTYECYRREQDMDSIKLLLPQLTRQKIISKEEAASYTRRDMSKELSAAQSSAQVQQFLSRLDKALRRNPQVIAPVIAKLVALDDLAAARKLCLDVMKKPLSADFLESIAAWEKAIPEVLARLKKQAEQNLIESEVNAPLLMALGNLEYRDGQLKEAQEHLEKALQLTKSPALYLKLAQVMAAQRLFEPACEYYAKAQAAAAASGHC